MRFLISLILDAAAGFLSVLPFLIILEILACRQIPRLSLKHLIGDGVFCFFLSAVLSVTGIPAVYQLRLDVNINLVPFAQLSSGPLQYLENILLFVPIGLLLPLLFPDFQNALRCVGYGFCFSLAIELLQLFCFRATDIDDLLMNTLGCAAGYGLFLLLQKIFPPLAYCFFPRRPLPAAEPDAAPSRQKELPALFRLEALFLTAASWCGALLLTPAVKETIWAVLFV